MDIYFKEQTIALPEHLGRLCDKRVMRYLTPDLKEKTTSATINSARSIEELDLSFLLNYRIFPRRILTFLTQWEYENRAMRAGDTIVQQIFIPPNKYFSQKIIVGVRVNEIFNDENKKGFSYETLEGHVEKGVSSFIVEKSDDGKLAFVVHTFSEPANIIAKLLAPLFSLPYQAYCTTQAIKNVIATIEQQK
jgi:hypothetical protein